MKTCKEIMMANPACCLADDKVYTISQRMRAEDIDVVLVVENYREKKLIGILTDRDIALRVVGDDWDITTVQVDDVMTTNPRTCHPMDDLDTTLKGMSDQQLRRLPVVNSSKQVLGIIIQARTIHARIAVRLNTENKVTAITIKDNFDGWADFADRLRFVLKQVVNLNYLTDSLLDQDDDLRLPAAAVG